MTLSEPSALIVETTEFVLWLQTGTRVDIVVYIARNGKATLCFMLGSTEPMPAFISHSHKDEAVYSTLCLALNAEHIEKWDYRTMSGGESLADQLRDAIHVCEVCVFLATRRSIEAPWCLAELGAFWGAGKKVLLFMVDPDLTETMLPPQFNGNLRVDSAQKLVDELKRARDTSQIAQNEFFPTSRDYGIGKDWVALLDDTRQQFDVLGIALGEWRKTNEFSRRQERIARLDFSLMHQDNELLGGVLHDKKAVSSVRHTIEECYGYYLDLASTHENISVRQIIVGIPHFFLTRSDKCAVVIQYLASSDWGSGPTWRCAANSPLFSIVTNEFEYIWKNGTKV